jgi:hypothetical protein
MVFFNLDKNSGLSIRAIKNRQIIRLIKKGYTDFKKDGASHVFTTYRIVSDENIPDINTIMEDNRAYLIASLLSKNAIYTARIKFIKYRKLHKDEFVYTIQEHNNPINVNRVPAIFNKDMNPSILTSIDSTFYNKAYPVTVTIYGLYKINKLSFSNI